jgi:polyphenol oxidase
VSRTPARGSFTVAGGTVGYAFTSAEDGDLGLEVDDATRHARQQAVAPMPWLMAHQVHGAAVLRRMGDASTPAPSPGAIAERAADAIVTDQAGLAVAVRVGDCAPVLLAGAGPVVAAVHAGWRGLVAGVVETAAAAMGVRVERALLGPCIGPCCYAFGEPELTEVAERFGASVTVRSDTGRTALDVPAAVNAALASAGAPAAERVGGCTGCGSPPRMYSHRVRQEPGRQAGVIWIEAPR